MLINCQEVARLEALKLDRPLTWTETLKLKIHHFLCRCPVCCDHLHQLEAFEQAISNYRESLQHLPPEDRRKLCREARERISAAMNEELHPPTSPPDAS